AAGQPWGCFASGSCARSRGTTRARCTTALVLISLPWDVWICPRSRVPGTRTRRADPSALALVRRVVVADFVLVPCRVFVEAVGVEIGRVLHVVPRHRDVDLPLVLVDVAHDTSGDHALLAEDPEPRVDDETTAAVLVRGLVDLPDVAVGGLDIET